MKSKDDAKHVQANTCTMKSPQPYTYMYMYTCISIYILHVHMYMQLHVHVHLANNQLCTRKTEQHNMYNVILTPSYTCTCIIRLRCCAALICMHGYIQWFEISQLSCLSSSRILVGEHAACPQTCICKSHLRYKTAQVVSRPSVLSWLCISEHKPPNHNIYIYQLCW